MVRHESRPASQEARCKGEREPWISRRHASRVAAAGRGSKADSLACVKGS